MTSDISSPANTGQKDGAAGASSAGPPKTACSSLTVWCGLGAFLLSICAARFFYQAHPQIYAPVLALFVSVVTALGVFIPELAVKKVHLRMQKDRAGRPDYSWPRTMTKCAGFIALLYWLFKEYKGSFYDYYYYFLKLVFIPWLLLAVPYIRYVDARMEAPKDGLWHMGRLMLFQWRDVKGALIRQHLLGWIVKGFFVPLMFTYLCEHLVMFVTFSFDGMGTFKSCYKFLYNFTYLIDVAFATAGYIFAFRLTDTHIRSTDPTVFGWVVALFCYDPFWTRIGSLYLPYDVTRWELWLKDAPVLYTLWALVILALTAVYALSTAAFGMRFSNLTHRGILTNGPYRWTKHPAYLSKNLSWWVMSVPFVVSGGFTEALRLSLLLLLLNGIYYLRAKTEERHLSSDPVYVQYAAWIDEHGVLALMRKRLQKAACALLSVLAQSEGKAKG